MKKGDRVKLSPEGIAHHIAGNRSIQPEAVRGTIVGRAREDEYLHVVQWDHVKWRRTISQTFLEIDVQAEDVMHPRIEQK